MMLTRCPYCSTTFRVTPEQLKVRQGQVRCGQCRRVFDGLRGLAENEPAPPTIAPQPAAQPKPDPHADLTWTIVQPPPPGAEVLAEAAAGTGFATVSDLEADRPPAPAEPEPVIGFQPVGEPDAAAQSEADAEPAREPDIAPELSANPEPEIEPEPEPAAEPEPPPAESAPPAATGAETPRVPGEDDEIEHIELDVDPLGPLTEPAPDEDAQPTPPARASFGTARELDPPTILDLHEPARAANGTGWPWLLGSLVALLLAAVQLALHFRTDLIAAYPDTRPTFVAACDMLGCQITLPRKIDLISIDASDLVPDEKRSGTLHLSATLRNRARYVQAWPHLEITLADAQERPLLRRALPPAEYLPADIGPDQGFPARSEQTLQLTLTTDVPAVGYRLYVFHP